MIDAELYIDAGLDYLREWLPVMIDHLNFVHDDFELPVPDDDNFHFGVKDSPTKFPSIDTGIPSADASEIDIARYESSFVFPLAFRAQLRHVTEETLARSLYRYGVALVSCLTQKNAFPGNVTAVHVEFGYDPETQDRQQFQGSVVCQFEVEGDGTLLNPETLEIT